MLEVKNAWEVEDLDIPVRVKTFLTKVMDLMFYSKDSMNLYYQDEYFTVQVQGVADENKYEKYQILKVLLKYYNENSNLVEEEISIHLSPFHLVM